MNNCDKCSDFGLNYCDVCDAEGRVDGDLCRVCNGEKVTECSCGAWEETTNGNRCSLCAESFATPATRKAERVHACCVEKFEEFSGYEYTSSAIVVQE